MLVPPKSGHLHHSLVDLKDHGEKILPVTRTLRVHLVVHYVLPERWPKVQLYTTSWAAADGFAG